MIVLSMKTFDDAKVFLYGFLLQKEVKNHIRKKLWFS